MPELPEAERGRRLAEKTAAGKKIVKVHAVDDRIVFTGVTPQTFARKLKGRKVLGAKRYGKHIWLVLDQPPHPVFHFGMSGFFASYKDSTERPKYSKIDLLLNDGSWLSMSNARRLGRIRLQENPSREEPISRLGFDPLHGLPSEKEFFELLSPKKAVIKSVLLDQSFCAGIGNWIADEVLYHAKLSPFRRPNDLSAKESAKLRSKIEYVIQTAVAANADHRKFPQTWMFHRRWRDRQRAKDTRPKKKDIGLRHDKIGGRTTAWFPAVQV